MSPASYKPDLKPGYDPWSLPAAIDGSRFDVRTQLSRLLCPDEVIGGARPDFLVSHKAEALRKETPQHGPHLGVWRCTASWVLRLDIERNRGTPVRKIDQLIVSNAVRVPQQGTERKVPYG